MSLGGPLHTTEAACGAAFPNTQNLAANLQAAGVAVVAAAGNDGSGTSVSYPGCLPSAFTVAATDDADNPAGFSNNNAITDWWAPGVNIDAPVTSGPDAHGTSRARRWPRRTSSARWRSSASASTATACRRRTLPRPRTCRATGDADHPRRRHSAADQRARRRDPQRQQQRLRLPGEPAGDPAAGGFNDFDFTVCSDTEPGEPGPFSLDNGIWYTLDACGYGHRDDLHRGQRQQRHTFDTTLAVYTGNTLAGSTVYAFDDDSGTGLRSQVVVPVKGGTTYRIKVDGFGAANGLLNLHVENGRRRPCQGVAATLVGDRRGQHDQRHGRQRRDRRGAGDDTINSHAGNDRICGGAGADDINAGDGDDFGLRRSGRGQLRGQHGNDTLARQRRVVATTTTSVTRSRRRRQRHHGRLGR